MTLEELLAEARRIARPCVWLTTCPDDGHPVGVWGGNGVVAAGTPDHRHWFTVLASALPEEFADLKLRGAISIYSDVEKRDGGICAIDPRIESIASAEGEPLYARRGTSLPPLTLLLRSGTPLIVRWLVETNSSVSAQFITCQIGIKELGDAYTQKTLFDPEIGTHKPDDSPIVATIGGWPCEIYEDDWTDDVHDANARQFAFTHRSSEPWIRVWVGGSGDFHIQQLIT